MRTMMLTGIRRMEMREIQTPRITEGSDVKIRMKTVGVCGSDIHYYVNGRIGSQIIEYPFPVGHEGAGEVVETGKDVTRVKPGDRVAVEPAMPCGECDQCRSGRANTCRNLKFLGCPGQAPGCLSEYIVMPESSCFPVTDNISFEEAALSEPLAIGVYAFRQSGATEDFSIGILGFGPIGMSVMLAAQSKNTGMIYVTDRLDDRATRAVKAGALWAGNPDNVDVVDKIIGMEKQGLDVVFECCGKQEAIDQAVMLLKPGGKIMLVGIPEFDQWSFNADNLRRKEISIINIRRQNHALEETLDKLSAGKIKAGSMVTHRYGFDQTGDAFDLVSAYGDNVMKAMIHF